MLLSFESNSDALKIKLKPKNKKRSKILSYSVPPLIFAHLLPRKYVGFRLRRLLQVLLQLHSDVWSHRPLYVAQPPHQNPVCSIQEFYVPRLNQTAGNATASNNTIYFNLKLDNENKDMGVYYEPANLTLYYGPNRSFPVANQTFHRFYQGHGHSARWQQLVDTHALPWAAALQEVSNRSKAVFRVDLATTIRFKILFWKTKKHRIRVSGDVEVDGSGEKVNRKKGIRLRSGAPELQHYRARVGPLVIVFTLICLVFIG